MSRFVVTAFWKLTDDGARIVVVDIAIRGIKTMQAGRHRSQSRILLFENVASISVSGTL
jgi:hypothetical protein